MKILIAPDSFKGSLTAYEAASAMAKGVRQACPEAETILFPLADGGEGTLDAWLSARPGRRESCTITGPLQERLDAEFGIIAPDPNADHGAGKIAVIEMANAAGLLLVPGGRRNPKNTTTYGVGELILAAIDAGAKKLIIGIGGSATNDGGAGALQALGVGFLDSDGVPLPQGIAGGILARIARIDGDGLIFPSDVKVTIASDVNNPLTGPQGASYVYSPQKGASEEDVAELDAGLKHYAALIRRDIGVDIENTPGAGAAGGLGAGLMAFLNAEMRSGIDLLLEAGSFSEKAATADLVLTGEGSIDAQTLRGKVISGVLERCLKTNGPPVIAIGGIVDESARETLLAGGLKDAIAASPKGMPREEAMRDAAALLQKATAELMARLRK